MTVSQFTVRNRWASVLAACIRTVYLHSVVSVVRYPNEAELQLVPTTGDRRGVNLQTSVALLGTFASLAVTALLALLFVGRSDLTGLADERSLYLISLGVNVDLQGIVLAGFVIGARGVLDDVTVTEVSAVAELHAAQPSTLASSAVPVGGDHRSRTHFLDREHSLPCLRRSCLAPSVAVHTGESIRRISRRSRGHRHRDHPIARGLDRPRFCRRDHHVYVDPPG